LGFKPHLASPILQMRSRHVRTPCDWQVPNPPFDLGNGQAKLNEMKITLHVSLGWVEKSGWHLLSISTEGHTHSFNARGCVHQFSGEIDLSAHDLAEYAASDLTKINLYVAVGSDATLGLDRAICLTKASAESYIVRSISQYEKFIRKRCANTFIEMVNLGDSTMLFVDGMRDMDYSVLEGEIELSALVEKMRRVV
jgi:hypothetical protein